MALKKLKPSLSGRRDYSDLSEAEGVASRVAHAEFGRPGMGRQAEEAGERGLPSGRQILGYVARTVTQPCLLPNTLVPGEPHTEKIKRLQEELKSKNYKAMVVNMLDEVAWLFNLRGSDIDFNPVFFAYAIVTQEKATLFVNPAQINETVRKHLGEDINIQAYDGFFDYLRGLGAELELTKKSVRTVRYKAESTDLIPPVDCLGRQDQLGNRRSDWARTSTCGAMCPRQARS